MNNFFPKARKNMVECQLRTNGVNVPSILDVFETIPRERFLSSANACKAYVDEDIDRAAPGQGYVQDPLITAQMLQAAAPHADDIVLNIGDNSGYVAALLSTMVSTVMTMEEKSQPLKAARDVWADLSLCNITVLRGAFAKGCPEYAPYSLIIINGAVGQISASLLKQIKPGGRLVTVVNETGQGMGLITLVEKALDGELVFTTLNHAATPYLHGFEPIEKFAL